MEDNKENQKINEPKSNKINIDEFLLKVSSKLSITDKISVRGKILNYLSDNDSKIEIINFKFNIYEGTEINPFDTNILIDIELTPNKTPYAYIRTDFSLPSLYDNRNIFYCLSNEHKYIYDPNNLELLETIIEEITNKGIENFLYCIMENMLIKTFIFYGEYELHSIYCMNNFLENSNVNKFYRVNQVSEKGKVVDERYIILTQLYILIFKPQESDRSFAELIFLKKFRNVIFNYKKSFSKLLNKETLILYIQDIKTPNGLTYEMEFGFIDRSRPPVEIMEDEFEEEEDDENEAQGANKKDKTEDVKNQKDFNSNNYIKIQEIQKDESNNDWEKIHKFQEDLEKKQKEINYANYKLIIESYRPLFNHRSNDEKKLKGIDLKNKIIEYEKMFQHCEKMYNYYKNKNDKKQYKKRIDYYIINIHFFCAELLAFFDLEKTNFQFYFDKMKYYLNLNEEN